MMPTAISPRTLGGLLAVLLLTGCTLGPEYQRPPTAVGDDTAFLKAPEEASPRLEESDVDPWWQRFGDPTTAELVEQALDANTDLRGAAARVLQAQAGLRQAKGRRWPQVTLGASATRQRNSFVLPEIGRVTPTSTTYSDSLGVSYQTDLFGGLRRSQQAAWADLLAREAARDTVAHTVISETVRGRVRLATLSQAADIARAIRDSWQETAELIEARHRRGLASTLELRLTRENLASAEAQVVNQERQLEQARLALDVLLGRRPGSSPVEAAGLDPLPPLDPVPLGLPVDLLDRRPDLRQAEMQLAAATARIGIAMADLFPGLTLTGSLGHNADSLGDLLSSETLIFNLVANLVGTVFDGGQRRAAVDSARAQTEEATAVYAGAVLQALREVEDALVRDRAWQEQLAHLEERASEARAADRMARTRYQRGVEELRDVLETERRMRSAEEALIDARSELWNARIDLHLALGGDWRPEEEARPETVVSQAQTPAETSEDPAETLENTREDI